MYVLGGAPLLIKLLAYKSWSLEREFKICVWLNNFAKDKDEYFRHVMTKRERCKALSDGLNIIYNVLFNLKPLLARCCELVSKMRLMELSFSLARVCISARVPSCVLPLALLVLRPLASNLRIF